MPINKRRDLTSAYKNLQTKKVYEGRYLDVLDEEVEMEGGVRFWRMTVEHPGAVVILPQISATELLITRQYRHSLRDTIYELPAGTLEEGELALDCAKREISEEVGHRANDWVDLGILYPAPGFCNERQYCYLARDLETHVMPGDDDEVIEVCRMSFDELEELIVSGELQDSKTIAVYATAKLRGLIG